jgi:hypothetical protein
MKKFLILAAVLALGLAGCTCNKIATASANPCAAPMAAAPEECKPVYSPPCSGGNWDPANLPPPEPNKPILCPFRGLGIPGLECPGNVTFTPLPQAAPCYQSVAPQAAAAPTNCGPYPAEAKPGEAWCCVWVQPPAAAPQTVCVKPAQTIQVPVPATYQTITEQVMAAPARTEWQKVECPPMAAQQECWALVTIPAVYQSVCRTVEATPATFRCETIPAEYATVASAPPPGFWQWQRAPKCDVGLPAAPAKASACVDGSCAK